MRISVQKRRKPVESIVPMINVVFLLLVFFLMTAQLTPPDPLEVVLPDADREAVSDGERALYVSRQGRIAFGDVVGEAALIAARDEMRRRGRVRLELRADAEAPGARIAALLSALAALGVEQVNLVTAAP